MCQINHKGLEGKKYGALRMAVSVELYKASILLIFFSSFIV